MIPQMRLTEAMYMEKSVKQESCNEVILFEGTLPRAILWSHVLMWYTRYSTVAIASYTMSFLTPSKAPSPF